MDKAKSLLPAVASCMLALVLLASTAHAFQPLYFSAGGASTWDYTTPNWWQANPTDIQTWSDGSDAFFQDAAGTVTVVGTIDSVNSITFGADSNAIVGGTIVLTGSGGSITAADNYVSTINSVLAGSVGLTKLGFGTLTLGCENSFTGDTYLNQGKLTLADSRALQNSTLQLNSSLSFGTLTTATLGGLNCSNSLAVLRLFNENREAVALSVGSNNQSTVFRGRLIASPTHTASLIKTGSGTLTLSSDSNFLSIGVTLRSGTLSLANPTILCEAPLIVEGGSLDAAGNSDIYVSTLNGSSNLNVNNFILHIGTYESSTYGSSSTYSGVISGSGGLFADGGGTLTLGNANTFTGNSGGNLRLAHVNALQNSTFESTKRLRFGTLTAATLGGLSGRGNVWLGNENSEAVTLSVGNNNQSTVFSGSISDSLAGGALIKIGSGTLTLTGAGPVMCNTLEVRSGTLALSGARWLDGARLIDVKAGAVLDASAATAGLALSSSQTVTGNGLVLGTTTVNTDSHIAPGDDIGTITLGGDLIFYGGILDFQLDDVSHSDLISMPNSTLNLGGLDFPDFTFVTTSDFDVGVYTLIDAGTITGKLGSHCSGTIAGLSATLAVRGNDLILTVVPEPGTFALLLAAGIGLAICNWYRRNR